MDWSSERIRSTFLQYFVERGHELVPSSPLVPAGDPTLLFANSGMVQFKDVFLGLEKRPYSRATTSQKCMRVSGKHNDFEMVGPSPRHNTFFEMLGNFSFGDYFKREAIQFAWDLLVNRFAMDPQRLWFTVFEGDEQVPADDEAERHWAEVGALPGRVVKFGRHDNFWQMGDTGPCGPNSEIHYYRGEHPGDPAFNRREHVNGEGEETVEIWNLVFMQYDRHSNGMLVPLPKPSVDTGAGLERMAAVLQNKPSNYDTDLFQPIIARTAALLGRSPSDYQNEKRGVSYRVIADHSRAIAFLIADGVNPSNEGRGYVTRLILRRAARHGQRLGFTGAFLDEVVVTVIERMGDTYPELKQRRDRILRTTREEEEKFLQTLRVGSEILDGLVAELRAGGQTAIPGEEAFRLHDTFGFPLDLTREVARENNLTVDEEGFRSAMDKASERSRAASGFGKVDDVGMRSARKAMEALQAAGQLSAKGVEYDPYSNTELKTKLVGILQGDRLVESVRAGDRAELVLAKTCFYVESGGQISDTGRIVHDSRELNGSGAWEFQVEDTRQPIPGFVIHVGHTVSGEARTGEVVVAQVDASRRLDIMRNHTATHLLHAQLRAVFGEHVTQAGSLVAPDRLRFDFAHTTAVSAEQLAEIERRVNEAIFQDYSVNPQVLPFREAIGRGAMALFTEKYGDVVRMMEIDGISRELCGGTHVRRTGEIGLFRIVSESSIGAGARRIEAVTGPYAYAEFRKGIHALEHVAELVRTAPEDTGTKVEALIEQVQAQQKEISRLHRELARRQAESTETDVRDIGGISVIAQQVQVPNLEILREQVDFFRTKIGVGIIAVGSLVEGKPNLVVAVSPDLVEKGFDARKIVNAAGKVIGGGGGGKPALAQAGGRHPEKLQEALDFVLKLVQEQTSAK